MNRVGKRRSEEERDGRPCFFSCDVFFCNFFKNVVSERSFASVSLSLSLSRSLNLIGLLVMR